LGKLPELQDGVSEKEMSALNDIIDLYSKNQASFDNAFNKMYKIGLPEYRKYCSPLQALFWLAEDNELSNYDNLISDYSLKKLLDKAWKFDPSKYRILSEKQLIEIIDGTVNESIKKELMGDFQRGFRYRHFQYRFKMEYEKSKKSGIQIFSENSTKIIVENLIPPRGSHRWEKDEIIFERLNSPELLDYYIKKNIHYAHYQPGRIRSPGSVLKDKYGDCDELATLGRKALTKAGYKCFGRLVHGKSFPNHVGLGIELDDGSYLLAVHFNLWGNNMSGPHKTLLELDQALGYGSKYSNRGSWDFSW
ncbi:MAG: hypothetical protein HKO91_09080, partial [Desulfobacterales bacterium]|nr:hypothetical protein [Desulfobacterales bacterium]